MLINAPGGTEVYTERLTEVHQLPEIVRGFKECSIHPVRAVSLSELKKTKYPVRPTTGGCRRVFDVAHVVRCVFHLASPKSQHFATFRSQVRSE
jgi:hypothetical protein